MHSGIWFRAIWMMITISSFRWMTGVNTERLVTWLCISHVWSLKEWFRVWRISLFLLQWHQHFPSGIILSHVWLHVYLDFLQLNRLLILAARIMHALRWVRRHASPLLWLKMQPELQFIVSGSHQRLFIRSSGTCKCADPKLIHIIFLISDVPISDPDWISSSNILPRPSRVSATTETTLRTYQSSTSFSSEQNWVGTSSYDGNKRSKLEGQKAVGDMRSTLVLLILRLFLSQVQCFILLS